MKSLMRVRTSVSLALIVAACGLAACKGSSPTAPDQSGVQYAQADITVGTGTEATAGKTASVQYILWLYSETGTDHKGSQVESGQFAYVIGSNQVIKGFDNAVIGMKVGGVRRVTVPPSLGYGTVGSGQQIPPNAALVFEIGLANVQ
jgi:FKBP-type peptidyl-prolyl cis-trans isomerase